MAKVIFFSKNNSDIGLKVRNSTSGPEFELLQRFVEKRSKQYEKNKASYAIFLEPRLLTGFPDAVIAEYDERKFEKWNCSRSSLAVTDIKLFYYFFLTRKAKTENIISQMGMSHNSLLQSLEKLLDAELVERKNQAWQIVSDVKDKISICNLSAIEAKINNWGRVFEQAKMNYWFARESYVLTPIAHPSNDVIEYSKRTGIGIYSMPDNKITKLTNSLRSEFLASYTSLMFNEWIGRYLFETSSKAGNR